MAVTREQVYAALFTQLKNAGPVFKTYSRRWKSAWDDPEGDVTHLPLLVPFEGLEMVTYGNRGIGPVRTWGCRVEVYGKIPAEIVGPAAVPDGRTPGASVLNPLIDAVQDALDVGRDLQTGLQSLGDLVIDVRIEGEIIKALGDEDPSGLCGALIPVKILVP